MAQAHHLDASASLASILEAALRAQQVPMSAQPLKRAPLRVLVGANMPAALIEIGYLTNDKQARQLPGAGFQNNVVQAVFNAILQFRARLEAQR
jgi:N-acetylmuramoyl-L-alanine amidase